MKQIFYQLIHQEKTKRWFSISGHLEEKQTLKAQELADLVGCTQRTIRTDIKEMKQYFSTAVELISDGGGYHFYFKNPRQYLDKKQDLLSCEPLFLLLDQLLMGIRRSNQEWADKLAMGKASFGRIKRSLSSVLEKYYQVTIFAIDNRLNGDESAIRQLTYDFYYRLPIYPKWLSDKMERIQFLDLSLPSGRWQLDTIRLIRWHQVVLWRIAQRCFLPNDNGNVQNKLSAALDEQIDLALPAQEKASLFLLALKEEQFFFIDCQKQFIHEFSPHKSKNETEIEEQEIPTKFFDTILSLFKQFFSISSMKFFEESPWKSFREQTIFDQLIENFQEQKKELERSLVVTMDLIGPLALQEWIKENVREKLIKMGYLLLDECRDMPYIKQIVVTNKQYDKESSTVVVLSNVPDETEIIHLIEKLDSYFLVSK